jgi:hypothetical protein
MTERTAPSSDLDERSLASRKAPHAELMGVTRRW